MMINYVMICESNCVEKGGVWPQKQALMTDLLSESFIYNGR